MSVETIGVYCDHGTEEPPREVGSLRVSVIAGQVVHLFPDRDAGQHLVGDRALPDTPHPSSQLEAGVRTRRRFRCGTCRREVPGRDDKLRTVAGLLVSHGESQVSMRTLKAMLQRVT